MRKLGQHFLRNATIVAQMVHAIAPAERDEVIEIGPGHGELSDALTEACAAAGARLTLIERDPALAEGLRTRFGGRAGMMEIKEGDALKLFPVIYAEAAARADGAGGEVKMAGNLPYYITGHLLREIGEMPQPPARAVFMIQQEVAERITAIPPHMNRLAASVQFWAQPSIIAHVSRKDFSPPPEVESAVIVLETVARKNAGSGPAKDHYYAAVRAAFAQPRKTLINNLSAGRPDLAKNAVAGTIKVIGLPADARPQDLSIDDIRRISEALF